MSSWGPKLEKKLKALADSASKESMQTLANWVWFNRKNAAAFATTFRDALVATNTDTRQWLYWQVLSECLFANRDNAEKWERASDLRATLGEETVVPALRTLGARALTDKIEDLLKQWDEDNVFGGPTIVGQVRRQLSAPQVGVEQESGDPPSETSTQKETPAPVLEESSSSNKDSTESDQAATDSGTDQLQPSTKSTEPIGGDAMLPLDAGTQRRSSLSSQTGTEIEYDFESKNVPMGVVEPREFLDPCKAVATLQIARDVRNDAPVELNSMISGLPDDVAETAQKLQIGEMKVEDLNKATVQDFSRRMPAKLLELDLDEQYQTIKTFQDIIRQQQAAREQLIYLLLKSRCQFGSQEAAKQFLDLQETSRILKKRKQLLTDALQLEGMDAELDTTDFEKSLEDLAPLAWYHENQNEPDPKRNRVD